MNSVTIHGRLARDPLFKTVNTPRGDQIGRCSFTVAVDRKRGEETDFLDCLAFGRNAELVSKWLRKGDGIVILGELQSVRGRDWIVLVENWEFAEKSSKVKPEQPPDFGKVKEKLPWEE